MISDNDAGSGIVHPLPPRMDAANSLLRRRNQPLSVFFSPKTVAVLGATESAGSMGRTVLWNLFTNPFGGTVFPVNPERASVLGIKAYPSIAAVPEKVDLAVIATPPETVPRLITECVDAGVQGRDYPFCRIQGNRSRRAQAGRADPGECAGAAACASSVPTAWES